MHPLKKNRPLRRIVLASAATVSGMVLLLSQKPHTGPALAVGNAYAIPELRREALDAQSAGVDTVSGAMYTSDGYRRSLQSALDSAGL